LNILEKLKSWCPQPKHPASINLKKQVAPYSLFRVGFRKSPSFFLCLSAFSLALGTFLQTVEIPVRITSDPTAAEQTDLMHAFFPFSFALWILTALFICYGLVLSHRQTLAFAPQIGQHSWRRLVFTGTLGALILVSAFLPWVVAEAANPTLTTRSGVINFGERHELTGLNIIQSSYWSGDVMYLVFVGAAIALFYIPLLAVAGKRLRVASAFLSILGGACVLGPIMTVATTQTWFVSTQFAGGVGVASANLAGVGIGLLVALVSAVSLVALGISEITQAVKWRNTLKLRPQKPLQ